MRLIVGIVVVLLSVFGGYAAMGGHLEVLWQPFEAVIILGAALGAFCIANPPTVLKAVGGIFGALFKGPRYDKAAFLELLGLQYTLFKLAKSKGNLALEAHVENPSESAIFAQFPKFASDHHAVEFMCDYLRMITLGTENAHELEALMDEELETHHQEREQIVSAMQALADGTPALGIVAASSPIWRATRRPFRSSSRARRSCPTSVRPLPKSNSRRHRCRRQSKAQDAHR